MLRPYTARSAYGVKKYFETADYYSQGNETVGLWGGKLAADFGLKGPVTKDAFGRLCDNIHPVTLEQLTPRMNENRRVGEDFVFSLPKDVGAYIMLLPATERDALLERIGGRVWQVMRLIEADVETRVRKDGAFENRPGDGLAWAGFLHTTARPVPGFAPDPHPHWHMFCFNATRDLVEGGRIKAADFAKIYRDRPFYEAVFYSLVAEDLAEARLPIERRPDGKWGLAGLQPLGKMFSKRTGEIEDEAKRLNIAEPGRKSRAGGHDALEERQGIIPGGTGRGMGRTAYPRAPPGDRTGPGRESARGQGSDGGRSGGLRHRALQREAVGHPRAGAGPGGPAARAGQRHARAGRGRAAAPGRLHRGDRRPGDGHHRQAASGRKRHRQIRGGGPRHGRARRRGRGTVPDAGKRQIAQ